MMVDSNKNSLSLSFEQMMSLKGECFRSQDGRLTHRVQLNAKSYFIKQHTGVGWKEIFKNILQLRLPILTARPEKKAIEKLKSLQIDVPSIVHFGQKGINPASLQSFILLEELKPVMSLEDLCQPWLNTPPLFSFKYQLIKQVAHIAKTLHSNGINHRDFYLCHFLLDLDVKDKLYLIDLHRTQIRKKTPLRWIVKDLAGLYFSSKNIGLTNRDLLRFIKLYTQQPLRNLKKTFWKKVKIRGEKLYSAHP